MQAFECRCAGFVTVAEEARAAALSQWHCTDCDPRWRTTRVTPVATSLTAGPPQRRKAHAEKQPKGARATPGMRRVSRQRRRARTFPLSLSRKKAARRLVHSRTTQQEHGGSSEAASVTGKIRGSALFAFSVPWKKAVNTHFYLFFRN